MYFSRISLHEDAQSSEQFWRIFRNAYTLHKSIWGLFADHADRKRDFLYRLDKDRRQPLIYIVSTRKPDINPGLWHIETKWYEPKIKTGMKLFFMLRANPIRTKRDEKDKQHRHDIVMEAKTRHNAQQENQNNRKPLATLVQEEGNKWLSARAEKHGFIINPVYTRADGYQQHRIFKGKETSPIKISTLDFNGLLTVINTETFIETLYKGIGPAKGFGCGLMMIRRA